MKLSICIPVYNFDVTSLIHDLKTEIKYQNLDVDIILIDDASDIKFRNTNTALKSNFTSYYQLEKNIGRSKIRNLFLHYSKAEFFLFLDCDCKIISSSFISKYLTFVTAEKPAEVIFGGRLVQKQMPESDKLLRWNYANKRENLALEKRNEDPYLSFQTNNFLIERSVFEANSFEEKFNKYGYEDLLFALNLKMRSIGIQHINNPVLNIDLETNESYLSKVVEAVESLAEMISDSESRQKIRNVKLVKAWRLLHRTKLKFIFRQYFKLRENELRNNLLSGHAPLWQLDIYKLGLLCEIGPETF